jgi:transcriptional regulator with XRE-family HTH domain
MLVNKINTLEQSFGLILREKRKDQGFSQEALALEAGVDRNFVSLLERGLNQPSLSTVFKLADALNLKPSDLVMDLEKMMTQKRAL